MKQCAFFLWMGLAVAVVFAQSLRAAADGLDADARPATGPVTLDCGDGKTVKVDVGSGLVMDANVKAGSRTLRQLIADEKAKGGATPLTDFLTDAVQAAADVVAKGTYADSAAVTLLSRIVKVAVTANPAEVASYVRTSVNGISDNPMLKSESATAITSVVLAAAINTGVSLPTALNAAITAASDVNISYTQSTFNTHVGTGSSAQTTPLSPIHPNVIGAAGG